MGDTRWDLFLAFLAGVAAMAGAAYGFWRKYGTLAE